MKLYKKHVILGVVMQGRKDADQWVKEFTVDVSDDQQPGRQLTVEIDLLTQSGDTSYLLQLSSQRCTSASTLANGMCTLVFDAVS